MYTWGRKFRFAAVSATVVLALTGFSSRGHGSSGHHGGSGGGCSNSGQDHDGSSVSDLGDSSSVDPDDLDPYGDDPYGDSSDSGAYDLGASTGGGDGGTYRSRPGTRSHPTTSSSGSAARSMKDGTAKLIHCASKDDPYATVEVGNPNGREGLFSVTVRFVDEDGLYLPDATGEVSVPAKDEATVRVPVAGSGRVDEIDHCEVDDWALVDE